MRNQVHDCLIPLQVSGTCRPLYCLHAVGGTVAFYAPLARRLSSVRDVYGLQCYGLRAGNPADRSIEAMAVRYVEAIDSIQPEGPYELIGYCMGGLIALEMARIIRARGGKVILNGVLDTEPPQAQQEGFTFAQALNLLSSTMGLSTPFIGEPGLSEDRLLYDFHERAVADGRLPAAVRIRDLAPLVDICRINGSAIAQYSPAPIPGNVNFLFSFRPGTSPAELAEGWQRYVDGEMHIETFNIDHFVLMDEQNAAQVFEVVGRWLTEEPE